MDIEDFRKELISEVDVWATADSNFRHSSFVDVCIHYLEEAGEVCDFEPCYYRGVSARRRNVGIDGYAFDRADGSLRIFLADLCGSGQATLTQTAAKSLFGKLRAFVEDAVNGALDDIIDENHPARALADDLQNRGANIARIRAYLLTDATLSTRVRDWPEGEIGGVPIEFHIWDISRFFRAHSSRSGQDELLVDLRRSDGGLLCLQASEEGGSYLSYLCVIPGELLADIYDEYGSRLLEGNVRAFLSTKGKVNKGIRNTVLHNPEMFFAYNNGIAATASAVDLTETAQGVRLATVTDLQIVNGGQTTASLSTSRRADGADLTKTFVPMKLSVIAPELSVEMIPQISRCANSQNKVSDADFFANHEFHRRLEAISRRMWAPAKGGAQHETRWFYERARGQYSNAYAAMTPAARRRFTEENPRDQVITKTDLAKSENSWLGLPQKVSKGAQSNFLDFAGKITEQWSSDRDRFNEVYFRNVVARTILFRSVERIVSSRPWYSGGYRANIVTYTIAKLSYEIGRSGSGELNFPDIWQKQGIQPELADQVAEIAKSVYGSITNPLRGHENVTQWCKKDECWLEVQRLPCALSRRFVESLLPAHAVRTEEKEARSLQQLDSGIDAQSAVVSLGFDYWQRFLIWGREKQLLQAAADDRAVTMAAGFVGCLPNDRQSKRLLVLKTQFEEEGFPPVPASSGYASSDAEEPQAIA